MIMVNARIADGNSLAGAIEICDEEGVDSLDSHVGSSIVILGFQHR